eukprot:scaffold13857_cov33-Prasinocladus_malaysianus.AAC.2
MGTSTVAYSDRLRYSYQSAARRVIGQRTPNSHPAASNQMRVEGYIGTSTGTIRCRRVRTGDHDYR